MMVKEINVIVASTRTRVITVTHDSNIGTITIDLCLQCMFPWPMVGNGEMETRRINPHHLLLTMKTGDDDVLKQ